MDEANADRTFEAKLGSHMLAHGILAEHLRFAAPCRSVEEAARAVGGSPEEFVKSVCLLLPEGGLVVAVVKGEDRASRSRIARVLRGPEPRIATPEEVLQRTGYPAGGVPPFGFPATFLVDDRVFERPWVYAGGGSGRSLLKIATGELLRACGGTRAVVRR